jgi:hypothetical protein
MRGVLIGLGIVAWTVAVAFGMRPTVEIRGPVGQAPAGSNIAPVQNYDVVNFTSAGAAFGFSLAGGLCFLGASLSDRRANRA